MDGETTERHAHAAVRRTRLRRDRNAQFPSGGWLDSGGSENGDKCAWITTGNPGASATTSLSTGSFPVQSLWSNAANSNNGGCVLSYR